MIKLLATTHQGGAKEEAEALTISAADLRAKLSSFDSKSFPSKARQKRKEVEKAALLKAAAVIPLARDISSEVSTALRNLEQKISFMLETSMIRRKLSSRCMSRISNLLQKRGNFHLVANSSMRLGGRDIVVYRRVSTMELNCWLAQTQKFWMTFRPLAERNCKQREAALTQSSLIGYFK